MGAATRWPARAAARAAAQAGVISSQQAIEAGMTPARIRSLVRSGHWRSLAHGVYATFTGQPSPMALLWVALLRAGSGAVAGPRASLWLFGLSDDPPGEMDVDVPDHRRVRTGDRTVPGIRRRAGLGPARHPALNPPRLRVEEAVLDVAAGHPRAELVIGLVLRAIQNGVTTPDRLAVRLASRRAHPWRELLEDVLAQAHDGVRSPLERRWQLTVERPHRLPAGRLNHPERTAQGRAYRDVVYEWGLVCELDGRDAHPDAERFRDRRRDNRVTVSGRPTLRYGWREIASDPCGVAGETAAVLRRLGWSGSPVRCGPNCRLP